MIFPLLLDYQKPDKRYLEELLTVLNLKDRRNHLPSQLSGGQQQSLAVGTDNETALVERILDIAQFNEDRNRSGLQQHVEVTRTIRIQKGNRRRYLSDGNGLGRRETGTACASIKEDSQFGLQAATRLHEAGIASNRGSECRGECVPGSCTHRPSHHGSWGRPKLVEK